ncbi:hypothetical protein OPV22_016633 [Ensete ventricosum]|uniref:C2 domain-containing protein n=1 Tax=Ensete ventricosum TaxID=4639 RepID=A0AAV8QUB7_ENSVE|nr:hypothetical protein OPV22_016633 [Ensete ventricosum]
MRLFVHVAEARGLAWRPSRAASSSGVYAKIKAGKHKSRTRAITGTRDPVWNEEFAFWMGEDEEEEEGTVELKVSVFREGGGDGGGGGGAELLGRVRVYVEEEAEAKPPAWFSLQPRRHRGAKSKTKDCGEILLAVSLHGRNCNHNGIRSCPHSSFCSGAGDPQPKLPPVVLTNIPLSTESDNTTNIEHGQIEAHSSAATEGDKSRTSFLGSSQNYDSLELSDTISGIESAEDAKSLDGGTFEDAMEIMQTRDQIDIPEDLQGGILLQQTYMIEPKHLNSLLYKPNSQFRRDLARRQGNLDYEEKPWKWRCQDDPCLSRFVCYTKAATKLVKKAVEATEEQVYLKADGKKFAVLNRVCTPSVPYGNCFQVLLLYKITPGPDFSSGETSSCLTISWDINFHQSTVMKGLIEATARRGLEESYESFAELLSQHIKPLSSKEHLLAPLQLDHRSNWKLFMQHLCNLTVCSTILMALYVFCHILLSEPQKIQGLEFDGFDLPDTFGELIVAGILVLRVQHVATMISHFIQARVQRGSDHGIEAHGDGWLLTVALVEGSRLPSAAAAPGFPDPYVVFSCNGRSRTSSVQLQTSDPQWNDILEFDAMQEPPSVLDVQVFSFDGTFDRELCLGHAEINFLRHTPEELADMWISLEGRLARSSRSKLHLRIFVGSTGGDETIREYLQKMEKEVGKKMSFRSPDKNNSTFQKIFALPPEEFLIHEFSCCLKRKLPLHGRVYLSARVLGFYANFFGYKTKFCFLWEDVEDMHVVSPSLTTVGSPALIVTLRSGRGLDARRGAKTLDEEGRLKFQFQSFASFNKASRTIMALWGSKSRAGEQHAKVEEDQVVQLFFFLLLRLLLLVLPLLQVGEPPAVFPASNCDVWIGVEWLRSTKLQKRITRNVCEKLAKRSKEMLEPTGEGSIGFLLRGIVLVLGFSKLRVNEAFSLRIDYRLA